MAADTTFAVTDASRYVAASADALATDAALRVLDSGGTAVDAAVAASALLAVTGPHLCGMGGDLFALVHLADGTVSALNASGRAGSGARADLLRADGLAEIPFHHHVAAVTVPGCVDGWMALLDRHGRLSRAEVFEPAVDLARSGFGASPLLTSVLEELDDAARANLAEIVTQATEPGARVIRPGVARTLAAIADAGRDGFYAGEFGDGLMRLGAGWFTRHDLDAPLADWCEPLRDRRYGADVYTTAPNSQGYLTLATLALAEQVGLSDDPDDPRWAHLLIESSVAAAHDRPDVLHEHADGMALLTAASARRDMIDPARASRLGSPGVAGDTTTLCVADSEMVVVLIQSNAAGLGSWLAEPNTGINLHNRGIGFSLQPGHPAELAPGARPPHTLAPALFSGRFGNGAPVVGGLATMGGDAQPQIMAQLLARLLGSGGVPIDAIAAPRWALRASTGFNTWSERRAPRVLVEDHAPAAWADSLERWGHRVVRIPRFSSAVGHANLVATDGSTLWAAADPRSVVGGAVGR